MTESPDDKKQEVIARLSMAVVYLSIMILILLVVVLSLWFYSPSAITVEQPIDGCGTPALSLNDEYSPKTGIDGSKLFKQNCAVCHNINGDPIQGLLGLRGIMNRVPGKEWLHSYISNSEKLFKQGDAYLMKLREAYPDTDYRKPAFQEILTSDEIDEIINYLSH